MSADLFFLTIFVSGDKEGPFSAPGMSGIDPEILHLQPGVLPLSYTLPQSFNEYKTYDTV